MEKSKYILKRKNIRNLIIQITEKDRQNNCLGINFGKSKITRLSDATEDYLTSLRLLIPYCDYAVINVSSPNTEGLRKLQDPILLKELLRECYYLIWNTKSWYDICWLK